jgi:hypothetical protein
MIAQSQPNASTTTISAFHLAMYLQPYKHDNQGFAFAHCLLAEEGYVVVGMARGGKKKGEGEEEEEEEVVSRLQVGMGGWRWMD